MITTGRILSQLSGPASAEVELVKVSPWSYHVEGRVQATIPPGLGVKEGDLVEVSIEGRGPRVLRRTAQAYLILPAAVFLGLVILYGVLVPDLRRTVFELLVIPLAWFAVFAGKALSLRRYARAQQN